MRLLQGLIAAILLTVVCVYCLYDGFLGVRDLSGQDKPKEVSLSQVLKERPRSGWLRITGGHLDYSQVVVVRRNSRIDRVYIPYVSNSGPIAVIASTGDSEILEAIESRNPPPSERILEGTVERTGFMTGSDVDEFKKSEARLDEPIVLIHRNTRPEPLLTWFEFLVGIVGTTTVLVVVGGLVRAAIGVVFPGRKSKRIG